MIRQRIYEQLQGSPKTWMCMGPMSKNCVDVAVDLANQFRVSIGLIASRRQIECAAMGGGYVEKWSTENFVNYVRSRDAGGYIVLARDHGGPYQNAQESSMTLPEAMASAKRSYAVDIESGVQIIHIDPSVDPRGEADPAGIIKNVFELYEFCWDHARKLGRDIAFEIGTEEQSGGCNTPDELAAVLSQVSEGCRQRELPLPLFVVCQTGTKVMETQNVGSFEALTRARSGSQLEILLGLCRKYGVLMKEHNTDYLSDTALAYHPVLGIPAANVAPEFGVVESRAFVTAAESNGHHALAARFLELAYNSRKWTKWMIDGTTADDRQRAIIAGHYVFATDEFRSLRAELAGELLKRGVNLDSRLKEAIRASMLRYLVNFRMVSWN